VRHSDCYPTGTALSATLPAALLAARRSIPQVSLSCATRLSTQL